MGRLSVRWVIAWRSSRRSRTLRSPYTTSRRYDGPTSSSVMWAAAADLLIGTPCGPSPLRTAKTETLRSNGTALPATASAATPEARNVVRSSPRRVRTPGSVAVGRSSTVDSTSEVSARRMIGSLTAMCTASDPMATQARA